MYSNKHVSLTYILRKFFFVFCLGLFHLKMGRGGEEILPIFETPLYKKMAFSRPPYTTKWHF